MAKGNKGKGDKDAGQPGSPREPEGATVTAKTGNTPGKAAAGSRAQSLRSTASFGGTRYSSLPSSGVVSRDALRASLARQVGPTLFRLSFLGRRE